MAIRIKKVKEAIEDKGINIIVHAPSGSGKTVLAATAGEPTLIISAESGLLSLNNDEMREINPHFNPDLCDVVEISEGKQGITELQEIHKMLLSDYISGNMRWKWICPDSLTEIAERILANVNEDTADGRQAYQKLYIEMTKIIKQFRDLPGYCKYFSSKQEPMKDEHSGLTLYSPMMPGKKLGNSISYLYDEVLCLRIMRDDKGEDYRCLQTGRDLQYDAKDRSGKLDMFEAPSLKTIYDKIMDGRKSVEISIVDKLISAGKESVDKISVVLGIEEDQTRTFEETAKIIADKFTKEQIAEAFSNLKTGAEELEEEKESLKQKLIKMEPAFIQKLADELGVLIDGDHVKAVNLIIDSESVEKIKKTCNKIA